MEHVRIELEVPQVLAEYADINSKSYKKKINQIMLYELVKNEKISIGKAAEAMGMRKNQAQSPATSLSHPVRPEICRKTSLN